MNTDKLMELERKWRADAYAEMEKYGPFRDSPGETGELAQTIYAQAQTRMADADELAAALRAEQAVGDEQRARELAEIATWHRRMHLELSGKGSAWAAKEMYACQHGKFAETLERALGTARQPENLGEFVISLLIAGGYVTQEKVDEARKIALSHGPYEMPARQGKEMVLVPKRLVRFAANIADEWMVLFAEAPGLEKYERFTYGPAVEEARDSFAMLAAAPGGEGEVGRG